MEAWADGCGLGWVIGRVGVGVGVDVSHDDCAGTTWSTDLPLATRATATATARRQTDAGGRQLSMDLWVYG